MTPVAQAALDLAAEALTTVRANVALNRPETTIRDAYYAMFRVARAYVVMKTGTRPKTHGGLITIFGRLALDLTVQERTIVGRLGAAFDRRLVADYDDEPSPAHSLNFRNGNLSTSIQPHNRRVGRPPLPSNSPISSPVTARSRLGSSPAHPNWQT